MARIQVQCVDHDLMITNAPILASGSSGVDSIQFSFCDAWEGHLKTAAFYPKDGIAKFVLLDSSNKCPIPEEIIDSGEEFEFGVYGVKEGKILSSELIKYRIHSGSFLKTGIPEPTPTVYEQIISQLNQMETDLENISSDMMEINSVLSEI